MSYILENNPIRDGKRWEDYETIVCPDGQIIDMQKLLNEQAKAKAALIHLEPMFGNFANKLHVVYTFRIATQATDGHHLFVNPQFTYNLTFEEKVFLLAHECMHCVLDHMRRGKQAGHDMRKSNVAADYEVNQTLVDVGLFQESTIKKLKGLFDNKYTGWSYEHIYDAHPNDPSNKDNTNPDQNNKNNKNDQDKQDQQDKQGGNQGNNGDQGDQEGKDDKQGGDQGDQDGNQEGTDGDSSQGKVTSEDCKGAYGKNMPDTPGGFMDTQTGNELAEQEGYDAGPTDDAVSRDWKQAAIDQAMKDNRTDAHGGRGKFYNKILSLWRTSTDWKKSFRKIIGRSLNTQDKRRGFANRNILATQKDFHGRARIAATDFDKFDALDYMTIFIDSSGSVTDSMLRYMLSEVYSIACSIKPETLVLVQLDTHVQECQIFHDLKEFNKYAKVATVKGRGGNYQQACWDFLRNDKRFKKTQSELVIMFTDGWLDQHKRDPKTMRNLCWAIIDNPSFKLEYPEQHTSVVYLNSKDIKK
jgi:predicted metal-dependent peptidase